MDVMRRAMRLAGVGMLLSAAAAFAPASARAQAFYGPGVGYYGGGYGYSNGWVTSPGVGFYGPGYYGNGFYGGNGFGGNTILNPGSSSSDYIPPAPVYTPFTAPGFNGSNNAFLVPQLNQSARLPQLNAAMPGLNAGVPALGVGVPQLGVGMPQLNAGLPALGTGLPALGAGLPALGAGVPQIRGR